MTKRALKRTESSIPFGPLKIDPIALGSQGNAVLGIRDSGKTYTATLLAEGLWRAGIPFTTFDPIGVWRFMRVPGAGRGYPVVVAGGVDGDLPLTVASAPKIVEAAMENGVSLVIDLYSMGLSKADWKRIVEACLEVMLHKNRSLRHVFLEEAAEFAPQRVGPDSGRVYAAVEKLARMGGNARLGYTLINQRAEEVNKAVLELCDNLFLHRQKGRHSLTALSKWLDIGNVTGHRDIIQTLPTLPTGECWAWMQGTDRPVHVKVPQKDSLHPDRRIMLGDDGTKLAAKTDVGSFVEGMRASLGAVEADAAENDPKALRLEIRRLEKLLAAKPSSITQADIEAAAARAKNEGYHQGVQAGCNMALESIGSTMTAIREFRGKPDQEAKPTPAPKAVTSNPIVPRPDAGRPIGASGASGALPGPQQRILNSLAWWSTFGIDQPTNEQVAFIAGYSPTSTGYTNPRSALRTADLIDYPSSGRVAMTEGGRAAAQVVVGATTVEELHRRVMEKLNGPQSRILKPLLDAHPHQLSNDEVAGAAGYSPTSTGYTNPRSSLKTLSLIEYPASGYVRAADWLFPAAR